MPLAISAAIWAAASWASSALLRFFRRSSAGGGGTGTGSGAGSERGSGRGDPSGRGSGSGTGTGGSSGSGSGGSGSAGASTSAGVSCSFSRGRKKPGRSSGCAVMAVGGGAPRGAPSRGMSMTERALAACFLGRWGAGRFTGGGGGSS